jgi:hypothetical protein
MQPVVDALGDSEEIGRALDHRPAHVRAGAAGVRHQRLEQLRDAAPSGRRVDVPHDPAGQQLAPIANSLLKGLEALGRQHGPKAIWAHR